ncbi:hypothetical protein VTK73DRAFT_2158 [Phialemonium thermophilum]|uniref:CENP-V/GFA domain-containing protein n=1 Tax=Phialemonium thermophilum TaxID=223376 RepID=A0ABR3X6M0_9PEZI
MSFSRPLRGGCHCGRNRYIVQAPQDATEVARVLFNTDPSHRAFLSTPLAAFLRVPLDWYRSMTFAFFPDETNAMIRRAYSSPRERHTLRHFCGFCGTPLTYWSENPRSEADYIQLALGSLSSEDLGDLEDMGLIPELDSSPPTPAPEYIEAEADADIQRSITGSGSSIVRETTGGLPWFDSLIAGSKLGNIRASKGSGQSRDGTVRYEWEIVEYTEDDDGGDGSSTPQSGKRKLGDREDDVEAMEGVQI